MKRILATALLAAIALCASGALKHEPDGPVQAAPLPLVRLPNRGKGLEGRFHPTYASVHDVRTAKARPVPPFLRTRIPLQGHMPAHQVGPRAKLFSTFFRDPLALGAGIWYTMSPFASKADHSILENRWCQERGP